MISHISTEARPWRETDPLSLRVSVATVVRVLFAGGEEGGTMLLLERAATVRSGDAGPEVSVMAKPFGGGVRIVDPRGLQESIGAFRYDSERSQRERDFRLQIRPASWENVKSLCRAHLRDVGGGILDPTPDRELAEEFGDALGLAMEPRHYRSAPLGMLVDNTPKNTRSVRAPGRPTARIYYVFQAWLEDPEIVAAALESSARTSDGDLATKALERAEQGGRGRANAALALGFDALRAAYRALGGHTLGDPFTLEEHRLAGSVPVILEGDRLVRDGVEFFPTQTAP